MRIIDVVMVMSGVFLLCLIAFLIIIDKERFNNAPCSYFKNTSVRYLPARCLEEYR